MSCIACNERLNAFFRQIFKAFFFCLVAVLSMMLVSCGFNNPPDLQQEIRKFFYENQTNSAQLFVEWAEKNLSNHSARRVQEALYIEGQYHAELGHPNAISVISFAARAWAYEKGLNYNEAEWYALQEEAIENIPLAPGDVVKFWTD